MAVACYVSFVGDVAVHVDEAGHHKVVFLVDNGNLTVKF